MSGFPVAAVLFVLPVIYVLSIGPVAWMCPTESAHVRAGPVDLRCSTMVPPLRTFYAPLLGLQRTPLQPALHWYVRLFDR